MAKKGRKMADRSDGKLDELSGQIKTLTENVAALSKDVGELKKKVDGDKRSAPDLSDLAALLPLLAMMPAGPWSRWWLLTMLGGPMAGCGTPALMPAALRIVAVRAMLMGRSLEHAAKITDALSKGPSGTAGKYDCMEQVFTGIWSQMPAHKEMEMMKYFWQANYQPK